MQKLTEVPVCKPEKNSGNTSLDECDNNLIARFEIYLGQILRVGRKRKRALRENDRSSDWEFMVSLSSDGSDSNAVIKTESSPPAPPVGIHDLLVDELRDILHAEKQLLKALPKMAKAARSDRLRECFEEHLIETEGQIERLNECFSLLGETPGTKPCKGMMALVEEGEEVMAEGEEKEDALAELALIGATQRVVYYEISGYTTAKNLAQQARHSAVAALLSKSMAEEENADQLLNQLACSLMPAAIERGAEEEE
jgi:Mn-containing catalase